MGTRSSCSGGSGASAPRGERFDGPVLALYKVRDGRLARAQMFYFDTPALVEFLAQANGRAA